MINLESDPTISIEISLLNQAIIFHLTLVKKISSHLLLIGTKCIDANTGLIHFKYDFGYEFGIIFPGEGRKYVAGSSKCHTPVFTQFLHNSAGAIDIPVLHEKTIKQNLWKQRNENNINDFIFTKNRTKLFGKKQPTVSFNLDELHNDSPRIRQHSPRKGAFFQ